jgi:hypothetical protein
MSQQQLSEWEQTQARNAHHRALIMQILTNNPDGLTVQQIIKQEVETYDYSFLTDNRLRELRKKGFVRVEGKKPQKWIKVNLENEQ